MLVTRVEDVRSMALNYLVVICRLRFQKPELLWEEYPMLGEGYVDSSMDSG